MDYVEGKKNGEQDDIFEEIAKELKNDQLNSNGPKPPEHHKPDCGKDAAAISNSLKCICQFAHALAYDGYKKITIEFDYEHDCECVKICYKK